MNTRAAVVLGTAGMVGALGVGAMTGGDAADAARIQAAKPYALRCPANPAPPAAFTYSPALPVVGEPLVLTSTTFDARPPRVLAAHAWSIDGRPVAGNVRQAVVTSVAGGMRIIGLQAFDGCARATATLPLFIATRSALNKAQTVRFTRSAKSLTVTLGPYPENVSGRATAKLGSQTLGSGRVAIAAGKTMKVKLTLLSAGRKALARRRTAKVKVASALTTASGRSLRASRIVTVRRR